jgi:hypothetical protein
MGRLLRIFVNAAAVVAIAITLLLVALCIRSFYVGNMWTLITEASSSPQIDFQTYKVVLGRGGVAFHFRHCVEGNRWYTGAWLGEYPSVDTFASVSDGFVKPGLHQDDSQQPSYPILTPDVYAYPHMLTGGGFQLAGGGPTASWGYVRVYSITLPLPLLILTGALIAYRLKSWRRVLGCQRSNVCLTCGYDLRETPNRCPECGSIPRSEAAASS